MASQRATSQRFRQRKLSVKQNLAILREHEIEAAFDEEAARNILKVETGVEKSEEIEHHLQAIISQKTGAAQDAYIPTPPTNLSGLQYERLYSPHYHHPQTYIRFSSTVEDCTGSAYCMNTEDEVFLAKLNSSIKKSPSKTPIPSCTEDQFEEVMSFFESTSALKQPFAAVDNAPVLSYAEMESAFDDTIDDPARRFAKEIYEHWKAMRIAESNGPLMPALKFERNAETDDSDPYVCFRRREVRQARKTRGRDAQIVEKLKKLRTELELARQLLHMTKQRELLRKDQLELDRRIFEHRAGLKDSKRKLGVKDGDMDLLIHQKPVIKPPRPPQDGPVVRRNGAAGPAQMRPGPSDVDLQYLADERARREADVNAFIQDAMVKHRVWNQNWVDHTWRPITPPLESGSKFSFRAAITEFLPTPPPSASDSGDSPTMTEQEPKPEEKTVLPFRYASPPMEINAPRPSYRRRVGRGGRLFIDRRGLSRRPQAFDGDEIDDRILERMEYDLESDEESDVYYNDPYSTLNMRYRAAFASPKAPDPVQQRMIEEARRNQALQQKGAMSNSVSSSRTSLSGTTIMASGVAGSGPPGTSMSPPKAKKTAG